MKKFAHFLAITVMALFFLAPANATKPAATLSIPKPTAASKRALATDAGKATPEDGRKRSTVFTKTAAKMPTDNLNQTKTAVKAFTQRSAISGYVATGAKIAAGAATLTVATLASIYVATNKNRSLSDFIAWLKRGFKKAPVYGPIYAPTCKNNGMTNAFEPTEPTINPTCAAICPRPINKDNDMTNAFGNPTEPTINPTCAPICHRQINKYNDMTNAFGNPTNTCTEAEHAAEAIINEYVKNFDTCETAFAGLKKECSPAHTKAEQKCKTAGILDKCQDAMNDILEKEADAKKAQEAIDLAEANEALVVKCEKNGCFGINYQEDFCRKDGCKANEIRSIYRKKLDQKREIEQEAKRLEKIETKKQIDAAYTACRAPIIETEDCKKANWVMREIKGCIAPYDDQVNEKEENCRIYKKLTTERGY